MMTYTYQSTNTYNAGNTVASDTSTVTVTLNVGTFATGLRTATAQAVKGVATFTGLIATRLTDVRLAGAAAFATVLLAPWAAEVTLWLVGRFDGWATLAIVISLWAALKSRAADRWFALSVMAAVVAYVSKESALILPVWIVLVIIVQTASTKILLRRNVLVTARATMRTHGLLIGGQIAIAIAYLVWRNYLFSGEAIAVYASTPEYQVLPLTEVET